MVRLMRISLISPSGRYFFMSQLLTVARICVTIKYEKTEGITNKRTNGKVETRWAYLPLYRKVGGDNEATCSTDFIATLVH